MFAGFTRKLKQKGKSSEKLQIRSFSPQKGQISLKFIYNSANNYHCLHIYLSYYVFEFIIYKL